MTDFIFLGSRITVNGDCIHEIKTHLLLERKALINLDSVLKSTGITDRGEILYDITYMCNPKRNDTTDLTKENESHRLSKRNYGSWVKGIVREFGMDLITLLYLKWTTNKDLLYSTENSAQCCVAAWIKVRFGGGCTYMYTYGWVPSPFTWNYQNIVNWLCAESLQSCLSLCNPMGCSPLGSSVHGILQARTLEWFAMPSSRGSSQPGGQTCISDIYLR